MAQLLKVKTTRKLPKDSDVVEKNGRPHVRLRRNGKTIYRPLTADRTRYRDESSKWYAQVKLADGSWKRVPGYVDKEATRQMAAELERRIERQQAGLTDPFDEGATRPIREHIDEFAAFLIAKGDTEKHVDLTKNRILRLFDGCRVQRFCDIIPSRIVTWLSEQRRLENFGKRTSNYYQNAAKELCEWMVKDLRVASNPLKHLSALNCDDDIRRQRRSIGVEEFQRLVEAAESSSPVQCIPGKDRAMLYVVAAWTGYRRKELSSVTLDSLDLDGDSPSISVAAAYSKRRRNDSIPLHPYVVDRLKKWIDGKQLPTRSEPLFALRTSTGYLRATSKMMMADLETARKRWIAEAKNDEEAKERTKTDFLTYCDADGMYADFHANRHTFISNLSRAGIGAKMAQTLARHSDPKLTLNIYTHVDDKDRASAIASLPSPQPLSVNNEPPGPESTTRNVAQETPVVDDKQARGTSCATELVAHMVAQTLAPACRAVSSGGTEEVSEEPTQPIQKPLVLQGLGTESHPLATDDESSGGGTRIYRRKWLGCQRLARSCLLERCT